MAIVSGLGTVVLTVGANVSAFVTGLGTASAATTRFATTHAAAMSTAGAAVAGFGALAVAGLGVSAKAAIDWEQAWAGVTKTVDGSTGQLAELEGQLREMAKTLPASHQEIAAVAEAAGQLGVKREDIASFTKTMIDLGVSTNLTADQAATALARFSNIMGTSASDVDRLGSALVALGNDGASTEGEIVTMALRIAGAGRSIGLTEGEVLALANTLSSLGIEAEAGGTAISTVMLTIQQATDSGGDALTKFARVAGVTAADFKKLFETDAASALQLFVDGLARADAQGQNTTGVMADLGFEGIRVTDTLRRLAANSDLLENSLELGNSAWAENRALVEEANKRYATTASQLQVARNNLRDTAITIGDQLLPVIQQAAEGFSSFADFLGGLPAPLLAFLTNMTAVIGGIGLLGGGLLLVVPQLAATITAFKGLAAAAPATAAALGAVGKAAGIVAALYAVGSAIAAVRNSSVEAIPGIEAMTARLLEMGKAGDAAAINELFASLQDSKHQFDDFAGAVERLTNKGLDEKIVDIGDSIFGVQGPAAQAEDAIAQVDQALSQLVGSGRADEAAAAFDALNGELGGTSESADKLMGLLPGYSDALVGAKNATEESASSTEALALGVAGVTQTTQEAQDAIDALSNALDALFAQTFSVEEATDAFASSLHALTASAVENGGSIDGVTQSSIANREALRASTDAAFGVIDAMVKQGASADDVAARTAELKQTLYDTAIQAGFSEEAAARYAGALDNIPATAQTTIGLNGAAAATRQLDEVLARVQRLDGRQVVTTITTRNVETGRINVQQTRMEADGGVLSFFADGAENHVAQIAPAGAWRVWAEPETGGEAYIPLAPAKRTRSVAIAQSVAERFGYDMVPRRPVQYMASGGMFGAVPTAAAPSLSGLTIEGTLDLGGGLTGVIRGVVREEHSRVARATAAGRR